MRPVSASTLRYMRDALRSDAVLQARQRIVPRGFVRSEEHARPVSCISRSRLLLNTSRRSRNASTASAHPNTPDSSSTSDPPPAASTRRQQTYYDLFPKSLAAGPPPSGPFTIDLKSLRNEFLQLQARTHPDLHPRGSDSKSRAEAASSLLNEAYKTLQDPLRRAQYILSLQGIATDTDEAAKLGGDEAGGLLMEVMEVNEAIEEAEGEDGIEVLKGENEGRVAGCVGELEGLFRNGDWEGARREAVRLRYWMNIKQSLDEWEPGKPTVLVH